MAHAGHRVASRKPPGPACLLDFDSQDLQPACRGDSDLIELPADLHIGSHMLGVLEPLPPLMKCDLYYLNK